MIRRSALAATSPSAAAGSVAAALPAGLPLAVATMAATPSIRDQELVQRALQGEADAFTALVARYQRRAFYVAFQTVGRSEDAQDIVQEAFVRLYRSLRRYDPARSFYTWFYRIVMNLAIDHLRRLRKGSSNSYDEIAGGLADPRAQSGEQASLQQEQQALVWIVLAQMEPRFRAVLVLRELQGISCREIAPILGITHATARWRLQKAREQFRQLWERAERQAAPGGGDP